MNNEKGFPVRKYYT